MKRMLNPSAACQATILLRRRDIRAASRIGQPPAQPAPLPTQREPMTMAAGCLSQAWDWRWCLSGSYLRSDGSSISSILQPFLAEARVRPPSRSGSCARECLLHRAPWHGLTHGPSPKMPSPNLASQLHASGTLTLSLHWMPHPSRAWEVAAEATLLAAAMADALRCSRDQHPAAR